MILLIRGPEENRGRILGGGVGAGGGHVVFGRLATLTVVQEEKGDVTF
jgi:hypothetical protein